LPKSYSDKVYQGTLTTVEALIDTIPDNTVFIMKGFFVSNNNPDDKAFTLRIGDGTRLAANHPVKGNDTTIRDNLHIPLSAGSIINISGEVGNDLDYYIWGVMEVEA